MYYLLLVYRSNLSDFEFSGIVAARLISDLNKSHEKIQHFNCDCHCLITEPGVKIYGCALPPGSEDSEVIVEPLLEIVTFFF